MSFRTLKPFQLSVQFRVVQRSRRLYGCFSLLTLTAGGPAAPLLRSEPSLWKALAEHAPGFAEAGVIKSTPEFLVFGHAHAYDGLAEGVAGVRFAGVRKWCRVFGPRRHPDAPRPTPFDKVALDWRHAYGGPDFAANPAGVGRARDEAGQTALPRFESPDAPWRPDGKAVAPVGFGPLDPTHPDRRRLVGSYGEDWLRTDFPGMARDADWHFFQVAPRDQWLPAELRGDEPFDFIGLHASERVQHGRLPGLRPRLFVERHQQRQLSEVDCRLRTVVFLPDAGAVAQVWQGITKLADEDGSELTHVLAGLEALDEPRPAPHYTSVFERRLDEQDGMFAMLRDEDLLPHGIAIESLVPADVDMNKPVPADSLQGRLEKKHLRQIESARAEVASHGLDPDLHAPPLPAPREVIPPPHLLGPFLRDLDRRAVQQVDSARERMQTIVDEAAAEFAAREESFDHVLDEMATAPTGPPAPRTNDLLDDLRRIRDELGARDTQVDEIDDMLGDEPLHERWHAADRSAQQVYEQSAHFQRPAPRTQGRYAERQKRWVAQRLAEGQPLKGFDLTGADLRGVDLRGARLDGAMMEAVCLDGVDLGGASARGTVLSHASLAGARADGCDFSGANLGKASFVDATACGADFEGAVLWETDFSRTALRGARLIGVEAMHMKLAGADLSQAALDELFLCRTDLAGVRFDNASIAGAIFLETTTRGTHFAGSRGAAAVFVKLHGEDLCFDGADLSGAMFVQGTSLPRASLRGTRLAKAFAHAADLRGADLSQADLDGCELGRCNLQGANLRGVTARDAGLRFADLRQAQMVGADLRGALLANADLSGARLEASSFFMADLSRVRIDAATRLAHANLGRARVHPRHEPTAP